MLELKDDKLVQVANDSLDIIRRFYRTKGEISDSEISKAKMASSMFGAFVKYKQHQSNMSAVKLGVANTILDGPDREPYLRASARELGLSEYRETKLIGAGISPESIKPQVYQIDTRENIAEPVK